MQEVLVKTHLIITDTYDEYDFNWCGKLINANPKFRNNKPIFVISGGKGRTEIETTDMFEIERVAKLMTLPKGKSSVIKDKAYIYIKEVDNTEMLLGILTHKRIRHYAPVYDKVNCT